MKERIKKNIYDQDVRQDLHCNAKAALKIESVSKQSKKYHLQIYVEESKCTDAENQQCGMLGDSDNDGYFEMKKDIRPEEIRLF